MTMRTKSTQNMKTTKTKATQRQWRTTLAGNKTLRWFLLSSGVLFATGLLKLLSLHQEIQFFAFPDPRLSFFNNWQITALAGAV